MCCEFGDLFFVKQNYPAQLALNLVSRYQRKCANDCQILSHSLNVAALFLLIRITSGASGMIVIFN